MAGLAGEFDNNRNWKVIFGLGTAARLPAEIDRLGVRRVLVVTGRTLASSDLLPRVLGLLGDRCAGVFAGPLEHAPLPCVADGAARYQECGADAILSLGGGSAVDVAKGIAMLVRHGDLTPLRGRVVPHGADLTVRWEGGRTAGTIPILALPTTLSGAEYTFQAGLTDPYTRRKDQYYDPGALPKVIILDGEMTIQTPRTLFLSSGIKSMEHSIERLYSKMAHPMSQALALCALKMLYQGLQACNRNLDDLEARQSLLYAAWVSQFCTGNVNVGISHAIGHQLCALCHIPHGIAACVLIPHAMEFNKDVATGPLTLMAEALGVPNPSPYRAIEAMRDLIRGLGFPAHLRDLGVQPEHLPVIAERTLTDTALTGNPRPVTTVAEVQALLEAAY